MRVDRVARYLVIAAVIVGGAACDGNNPIGPSNSPEIANNPDNFQFQASNLTGTTQTLTYTWTNTGTSADINQSGSMTSGAATLVLSDANNVQVYSGLMNTGTFHSASGASGGWHIVLQLTNARGTLNFRVQKP